MILRLWEVSLGEVEFRPLVVTFCLWALHFVSLRVYFGLRLSDLEDRKLTFGSSSQFLATGGK